jgi:hypothetical protein
MAYLDVGSKVMIEDLLMQCVGKKADVNVPIGSCMYYVCGVLECEGSTQEFSVNDKNSDMTVSFCADEVEKLTLPTDEGGIYIRICGSV